jgi:hypothetical protein
VSKRCLLSTNSGTPDYITAKTLKQGKNYDYYKKITNNWGK